uniref:WGS project CAEQ00000000 data, annotated contig 812 n=1 Tax=Trypanosoma congolense (strain IL3000) TaxID=1068625 RepID=F9WIL6_TRYCI|nr:unnamed protein product [Trypanosoma congolense IL3000]
MKGSASTTDTSGGKTSGSPLSSNNDPFRQRVRHGGGARAETFGTDLSKCSDDIIGTSEAGAEGQGTAFDNKIRGHSIETTMGCVESWRKLCQAKGSSPTYNAPKDQPLLFGSVDENGREATIKSVPSGIAKSFSPYLPTDDPLPALECLRSVSQNTGSRSSFKYNSKAYASLLPSTLQAHMVINAEGGVNDKSRARGSKCKVDGKKEFTKKPSKLTHDLDQRHFEAKMRQIEDSARRFYRYKQCVTVKSSCDDMMVVCGFDDENAHHPSLDDDLVDRDELKCAESKDGSLLLPSNTAAARERRLKDLRHASQSSRCSAVLRMELKKSAAALESARRHATNLPSVVPRRLSARKYRPGEVRDTVKALGELPEEEVSWDAYTTFPAVQKAMAPEVMELTAGSNDDSTTKVVTDQRAMSLLQSFLFSGRRQPSCSFLSLPICGGNDKSSEERLVAIPGTSIPLSTMEGALDCALNSPSVPVNLDRTAGLPHFQRSPHGRQAPWETKRARVPVSVGYGMSDVARKNLEEIIEEFERGAIEQELRNAEDLKHTRMRLLQLIPERQRLIDKSLAVDNMKPQATVLRNRQRIFRRAAEIDVESQKQACFSFLDLLEECCHNSLDDSTMEAVFNVVVFARGLIQASPSKCTPQDFSTVLNECFTLEHLADKRVIDALEWLGKLFNVSREHLESMLNSLRHRLSKERDYEARFRAIDRAVNEGSMSSEKCLLVKLQRCRFRLLGSPIVNTLISANARAMGRALSSDITAELPEVTISLQAGDEVTYSSCVSARSAEAGNGLSLTPSGKGDAPNYVADFGGEALQIKAEESSVVFVSLLCGTTSIGSGSIPLASCSFLPHKPLSLRLRLLNKRFFVAYLELSMGLAHEKEHRGKHGGK